MNIYFSGIGGVGVGPLAEIAYDAGYGVAGSDIVDGLITKELRQRGIVVNIGQDGSFLQARHHDDPVDWFIYTAALPADHPELVLAKKLGIKTVKRDELIAHIISEKNLKLIAVAGTHGKTTTTGMLIWALQQLSIPISYSIGTTISFGPSGKFDPESEYFIYECDEFDRNFLHFKPYLSLITSIDYDHPDTYVNETAYLKAFTQFARQSQQVVTWRSQHSDIFAGLSGVRILDESEISAQIKLVGRHNRQNGTLVEIAMQMLGFDVTISSALASFPGTDRRFEKLADNLYSDYGHHPVEIAATLQLAREISDHILLVYQPHQNVRQHQIREDYTNQFELADEIYWLPTYLSREDPRLPILQPDDLTKNITNKTHVHAALLNDNLWDVIQNARLAGTLVLCMGAGSIDSWIRSKSIQDLI